MTLSEDDIARIKAFYKVERPDWARQIWLNDKFHTPLGGGTIYLAFGKKTKDPNECMQVDVRDLYRAFYPEHEATDLPDERSLKYIEAVKRNVGLVKTQHGWDGMIPANTKPDDQLSIWANATGSGYTDLWQMADGNWVAETCFRTDIDDYQIMDYVFDHKPSKRDILTVHLIERIEIELKSHPKRAVFQCWECGRSDVHWLDGEGDLEAKWEAAEEKYCGC